LHIDRAYLSSPLVRERPANLTIYCKAWPVRNGTGCVAKILGETGGTCAFSSG
jgi:hypothetical protein